MINRSVITTCRLLHTYKCTTLLLIPGIYFTVTSSSASLNSCHFPSFYSNIDSNMPYSINICSLQPVSGMHIAQRTKQQAQSDSCPCQVQPLPVSCMFCSGFERKNLKSLCISCLKDKAFLCITYGILEYLVNTGHGTHPKADSEERSLILSWKGQEGQCPWISACAAEQTPKSAVGVHSRQRICLQGQCKKLSQSLCQKEDRLPGSQGDRGATRTHLERCLSPESGSSHDLLNWFSCLKNDLHCLPC